MKWSLFTEHKEKSEHREKGDRTKTKPARIYLYIRAGIVFGIELVFEMIDYPLP